MNNFSTTWLPLPKTLPRFRQRCKLHRLSEIAAACALGAMARSLQWMRSLLLWYRSNEFKDTEIVAMTLSLLQLVAFNYYCIICKIYNNCTVGIKALGESECVKSFHWVQSVQGGRARSLHILYELVASKIMKSFLISKDIILDLWNRSD